MKRIVLAAALLTVSNANATGIPVVDAVNNIQRSIEHGLSFVQMVKQLDEAIRIYEQTKASYESMTGIRNLGDVFDSPELRQYLPDDWIDTYDLLDQGYDAMSGDATALYNKYKIYDACEVYEADDARASCELKAVSGVMSRAQNMQTALLISERAEQLRGLQSEINRTQDPKAIAELQARISIEQASIANESTRLENQQRTIEATKQMQEQRDLEFNARAFSATKGIEVEPLIFD